MTIYLRGKLARSIDHALDNAYLGIFDFSAPIERGAEYDIFVKSMELTPFGGQPCHRETTILTELEYEGRPQSDTADCIIKIRFEATEKIARDELVTELSLQNFEIAVDIENVLIEDGPVMHSELSGRVDIKNHFSSDIEFDVQVPLPLFEEFMHSKDLNTVFTGKFAEETGQRFFASFLSPTLHFQR